MPFSKDVMCGLLGLALGGLAGCALDSAAGRLKQQAQAEAALPRAHREADSEPAPPLRIPVDPAQAQAPTAIHLPEPSTEPIPPAPPDREKPSIRLTSAPVVSAGSASSIDPTENLQRLDKKAAERFAIIDSYQARLRRREQVNGKNKPEEIILFRFRKQPWSVYLKWIGAEGKGREVLYVKGQYDDKLHTILAPSDSNLFMPAGKHMTFAPDSVLVRSASRHSITEAGIGYMIDQFGRLLEATESIPGKASTIRYVGMVSRPEFATSLEGAEQTIAPGSEPALPRGGRRLWLFDTDSHLPVLTITRDESGQEVEYYCYDRFQFPGLDDDDFNPEKLWPNKE